jgi:hypothetical protein
MIRRRAPRKRRTQPMIIARWKIGKSDKWQACATADVARSVIKALLADPSVNCARAYYNDGRGVIDGFDRSNAG